MATAVATNVATLNAYVIDQRYYMFTTKIKGSIFFLGGEGGLGLRQNSLSGGGLSTEDVFPPPFSEVGAPLDVPPIP